MKLEAMYLLEKISFVNQNYLVFKTITFSRYIEF